MTSQQVSRPLTDDQVDHYYREGYVVVPGLVPASEVDSVMGAAAREFVPGEVWAPNIFDYDAPSRDPNIHRLLVEPHIVGAVEQVLESQAAIYYGMLAVVPAGGGQGLPWHQDGMYAHVLGRALNCFVALCDITPDKAALWVAPESHKLGIQAFEEAGGKLGGHRKAVQDPGNGIPLPPMKKGDVCIFDRLTLHRSLRNETDQDRYAYASQYCELKARHVKLDGKHDPRLLPAASLADAMWRQEAG